jgi:threonine dehydrogenase-like Zn-dependent dehydrogenase
VILLGSPRGKAEIDLYNDIHVRGTLLIGAHGSLHRFGPHKGSLPALEYAMEMIGAGFLQVRRLVTHTIEPQQIQEAYRMLIEEKNKALGIVIAWPSAASLRSV